jgi:hypothetical protein
MYVPAPTPGELVAAMAVLARVVAATARTIAMTPRIASRE